MKLKKIVSSIAITSILSISVSSCTTAGNVISHKDLNVQSKMSETIFLDPVKQSHKVVLVSVKNTSGSDTVHLKDDIVRDLEKNGWKITNDPDSAYYMIQVNILQAGEAKDKADVMSNIETGFGSVVGGGLIGTGVGLATGSYQTGGLVGVTAMGADYIGSKLTEDKAFSVITDVQISQKINGKVSETTQANLSQGNATSVSQSYNDESNWLKHRVRVGTVADQMNLTMQKALPEIEKQLSKQIVGILA
ncbi:complement resistance protein TraT [Francisella philomiragia]|uniref:Enterobacterial TraT complement resistance family protein n=1 Tax=Francisella philomiragia TaxID=28110 RepID=A0A0B6D5X1_9GAMM|nr:complement resistance protein TraT [Francisella philomiragia]AJI54311.1 enterobacterial TraT complement resistance family protein [Francisella philomiragia]